MTDTTPKKSQDVVDEVLAARLGRHKRSRLTSMLHSSGSPITSMGCPNVWHLKRSPKTPSKA